MAARQPRFIDAETGFDLQNEGANLYMKAKQPNIRRAKKKAKKRMRMAAAAAVAAAAGGIKREPNSAGRRPIRTSRQKKRDKRNRKMGVFSRTQRNNGAPLSGADNVYSMTSKPHGWCLIVHNVDFENLNKRLNSDRDAQKLEELFTQLQYKVKVYTNLTAKQISNTVCCYAKKDHSADDSIVVCLLSHGLEGQICGVDGIFVKLTDLLAMFNGTMAKDLIGKPKLFFVEACHGTDYDYGTNTTDGAVSVESCDTRATSAECHTAAISETFVQSIPFEADMLVAFSTLPGYGGSWFVRALDEVFSANARTDDLVSMLVRVNSKVAREFQSFRGKKQMPSAAVMFTNRKLFFYPPT